jgi:hypothetical protein
MGDHATKPRKKLGLFIGIILQKSREISMVRLFRLRADYLGHI